MNHDHGMLIERTPSSQDSLPDSQASFASIASTAASVIGAPRLLSSSSNISTSTISDTQLTFPISSTGAFSQFQQKENLASPKAGKEAIAPPRLDTNVQPLSTKLAVNAGSGSSDNASTITSPMSIDTPGLTHGSKRTASGTVKSATAFSMDSPQRTGGYGHARNMSLESNASNVSRVGELSAQLKTRLSYAMVKVQHGWEHQSLDELEEQTSRKPSPLSHMRPGERLHHSDSPQSYTRRRSSGQSDSPDRLMFSPGSQPTPSSYSRNSTPGRFSNQSPTYGSTAINHGAMPVTSSGQAYQLPPAQTSPVGRALAPAAPIVSRRPRRSNSTHAPPSLLSTQRAGKSQSDLGPATKPPTTPRAGILRMPSQQAEKDAVDTLLFMSSPNNSAYVSQVSNSATQPSPLRSDFTMAPKRVVFEMEGMDGMTKAMNVPHLPYPNSQPS